LYWIINVAFNGSAIVAISKLNRSFYRLFQIPITISNDHNDLLNLTTAVDKDTNPNTQSIYSIQIKMTPSLSQRHSSTRCNNKASETKTTARLIQTPRSEMLQHRPASMAPATSPSTSPIPQTVVQSPADQINVHVNSNTIDNLNNSTAPSGITSNDFPQILFHDQNDSKCLYFNIDFLFISSYFQLANSYIFSTFYQIVLRMKTLLSKFIESCCDVGM
jgi:hypothetical protein